jgi:hypothetical protein
MQGTIRKHMEKFFYILNIGLSMIQWRGWFSRLDAPNILAACVLAIQ